VINNKSVLAIIPARAGSKGVKNKNIREICGKPLIAYTIEAAKNSNVCDSIIVSTDSEKIAEVATAYGAEVPFLRSEANSGDISKTIDAIIEVIDNLKKIGRKYDIVILLQPTSPLRDSKDIVNCLNKFFEYGMLGIASITEITEHPILFRLYDNGKISKERNQNSTIRKQDFDKIYKVNGAIYINLTSNINESLSFNDNEFGYIMNNLNSVDIDTEFDLKLAELLINGRIGENIE